MDLDFIPLQITPFLHFAFNQSYNNPVTLVSFSLRLFHRSVTCRTDHPNNTSFPTMNNGVWVTYTKKISAPIAILFLSNVFFFFLHFYRFVSLQRRGSLNANRKIKHMCAGVCFFVCLFLLLLPFLYPHISLLFLLFFQAQTVNHLTSGRAGFYRKRRVDASLQNAVCVCIIYSVQRPGAQRDVESKHKETSGEKLKRGRESTSIAFPSRVGFFEDGMTSLLAGLGGKNERERESKITREGAKG